MIAVNELKELLRKWERMPGIEETGPEHGTTSPVMARLRIRFRMCYIGFAAIGLFLGAGSAAGLGIPAKLGACAMGLIIPGGGFLALGKWYFVLIGLGVLAAFFGIGRDVIDWYGNITVGLLLYLLGILGGLFADTAVRWTSVAVPVLAAACTIGFFLRKQAKLEKRIFADREKRIASFPELERTMENLPQEVGESERELDEIGRKAARYLFDMTVREKGDFTDYNKTTINSMGAYRYQFASLGYALMLLQCKYTPNFHGYQNKAWRFLIEAFTDPRCCGYWKWEELGGRFRWNCDPVASENIMLSGWMLPVVTAYGAHTGDRRYERENSICFRPFRRRDQHYDYSAETLTKTLVDQWADGRYPANLIPCEPNIAFPVCNSYAVLGTMIYDRDHGTHYTKEILDTFNTNLAAEFVEADGCIAAMRHYLFGGCRFMHKPTMVVSPSSGISISWQYAPIYPGLARRCYAILKKEIMEFRDGMAFMKGLPWEETMDLGTMTKNPSMFCGLLEQTAAEYGDRDLLQAMEAVERCYLSPSRNPNVLRYKGVAVVNMANIALSKWAKAGDWKSTILDGPGENALKGPILDECTYPDVMVSRAISRDGEGLDLILYSGSDNKVQNITLRRLIPGEEYVAEGVGQSFTADGDGNAVLTVRLSDRTPIYIWRKKCLGMEQ